MPHAHDQQQGPQEALQQQRSQGDNSHPADSINQQLDQLVLQYMTLVQDYLSSCSRISEKFQEVLAQYPSVD